MEKSKFARTTRQSEVSTSEVVSLSAFRSKKSSVAIVQALKIVQAAEVEMGIDNWSPALELAVTGYKKNARKASTISRNLTIVRQETEHERKAVFAKRMYAITGNAGYLLAFSAQ